MFGLNSLTLGGIEQNTFAHPSSALIWASRLTDRAGGLLAAHPPPIGRAPRPAVAALPA